MKPPTEQKKSSSTTKKAVKPRAPFRKSTSPSPWQALVISRMEETGLTTRALAQKISTRSRKIYNTTVWAWTLTFAGAPPKETYTAEVNKAMAKALEVSEDTLAAAYDASRAAFKATNADATKRLGLFRRMIAESSKETWTKTELLERLDEFLSI